MKISIADKMYLFLASGKSNVLADSLVISAHGGIRKTNTPDFTVNPPATLQFYSDHGQATGDWGIHNFASGGRDKQKKDKILPAQKCYDYDLTKYQGRHNNNNNNNETYESIEQAQALSKEYENERNAILNDIGFYMDHGIKINDVMENYPKFDVLTIRKKGMGSIKLSVVLKHLQENNLHYNLIHCYFCRSFYFY